MILFIEYQMKNIENIYKKLERGFYLNKNHR